MDKGLAMGAACARWLRDNYGCNITDSRGRVMGGRVTRVIREDTPRGSRFSWGHMFVRVEGKPGQERTLIPGETDPDGNERGQMRLTPENGNVMADLLRAAYANAPGAACGGRTLYEMVWEELDTIVDRMMTGQEAEDGRDPGRAEGVAYALAVFTNPYLPNIDAIREQAMERWEARDEDQPEAKLREPEPARPTRAELRARRRARQR